MLPALERVGWAGQRFCAEASAAAVLREGVGTAALSAVRRRLPSPWALERAPAPLARLLFPNQVAYCLVAARERGCRRDEEALVLKKIVEFLTLKWLWDRR